MNLADPKLLELAKKHPIVQELIDVVESYESDPAKVFYNELREMVLSIAREMKTYRLAGTTFLSGDKEDKIFERVRTLMVDAPRIFEGLKQGAGEGEQEETGRHKKDKKGSQVAV